MRVVLDTNVFIAALLAHGLCRKLVRRSVKKHTLISSPVLLEELRRTARRKLDTDPDTIPLIAVLRERTEWVKPEPLPKRVCPDVDDDWVLATAVTGRAHGIVTGDEDLLVLKKYGGIRILSPRQFLELLDRRS